MKKTISIMLILIILFSFFMQTIAYASIPETILKYSYGLIAFAAALTGYGVTVTDNQHVKLLYDKFVDWSEASGTTEYLQNSYYQSQAMITNTTIGVLALGIGLNTWIRTQFEKGYNSKEYITGDNYIVLNGESVAVTIKLNIQTGEIINYNYFVNGQKYNIEFEYSAGSYNIKKLYINDNLDAINKGIGVTGYNDIKLTFSDGNYSAQILLESIGLPSKYSSRTYPKATYEQEPGQTVDIIKYYASEAVDYPIGRNPDDRDINLPPPNLGSPNLTYDGQDYIYTGTPDQFLEEYAENQDYINKALDSVLDNAKSISQPIVDTTAGTITWTNTGAIDYPLNPPIVNPPVTVPSTVEEGIGETNSILQGVTEYIGNIFSPPTLALDFSPIMQVALTEKFPFCLPYDLKTLISGFDARAEAPEWELKWKVKDTEVAYKVEFKQFEKLAEITRWGVTLLYVVSLIMISRKLIGGE